MLRLCALPLVLVAVLFFASVALGGFDHGDDVGLPIAPSWDAGRLIQKAINDLKPINPEAAAGLQEMLDNGQINIGMGPRIENAGALTLPDGEAGVEGDAINVNERVMTGGLVTDDEGHSSWRHNPNDPATCSGHDWNNFVAALAHEWVHANTGGLPIPTSADTSAITDYCWEKPAYEKELAVLKALGEPSGFYPAPPGEKAVKTRREQLEQELNRKRRAALEELGRKGLGIFLCAPTGDGTAGGYACTVTGDAGEPVAVATWFADGDVLYCSVPTFESGLAVELPLEDTYSFAVISAAATGIALDVVLVAGVREGTGVILGFEINEDEMVGEVLRIEIPDCEPWSIRYQQAPAALWVFDGGRKRVLYVEDTDGDMVPDTLAAQPYATADEFPILGAVHEVLVCSTQSGVGASPAGYGSHDVVNILRPITFLVDEDSDGIADSELERAAGEFARFAPRLLDDPQEGAALCRAVGVAGAEVTLGTCDAAGVFLGEVLGVGTVGSDYRLHLPLSRPLLAGELIRLYDPVNELAEESGVYEVAAAGANREPRAYAGELQLLRQTCPSGALVTLDASASHDLDGDPLTFEWQEMVDSYDDCPVLGTGEVMSVWMQPGVHSIRLLASDGEVEQRTYTGVGVIPYYGHFPDVPGPNDAEEAHWAFWSVEAAHGAGIVAGYPDGLYHPEYTCSRDQMAVFVARALAGGDDNVPTGPAQATFDDVPTYHWAYKYIEYVVANDIAQGYDPVTYAPSLTVDRGQMAVFIARAIATPTDRPNLTSYTPPPDPTFPDVTAENDWGWCHRFVEYIAAAGITSGYPDGLYHPEYACSRDQMAVYVTRAFELELR